MFLFYLKSVLFRPAVFAGLTLLPTNCLSVFDHFVKLALKGRKDESQVAFSYDRRIKKPLTPIV